MARENFSLGRTHRGVYLHLAPLGARFVSFRRLYEQGREGRGLGFVEVVK